MTSSLYETHLSIDEQINLLKSRGMRMGDEDRARMYLSNIGYFRLRAYWFTFQVDPSNDKRFSADASFDLVKNTYVFDRKLRLLLFDEIERIESSVKSKIVEAYCSHYDARWYADAAHFENPAFHAESLKVIDSELSRSKEKFMMDYRKSNPGQRPPAWMAFQLLSLGQVSKLYKNLKASDSRKAVAEYYKLNPDVLSSWLETLTFVRNVCAHHARLWNRVMPTPPKVLLTPRQAWLTIPVTTHHQSRIYYSMAMIRYFLHAFIPDSNFSLRLKELLDAYTFVPRDFMGFPRGWQLEPLWNSNGHCLDRYEGRAHF